MAADKSMTDSAEIVAKATIEERSDFLKESAAMIAQQVMEAEIAHQIGARKGEISGERSTHRNGYRQRPWSTRVGEIELSVPRKRSGESYFPSFLEPRKRSEKALLGVVMEAHINGVSTRKVDRLVSELGIHMSKDQVSRICGELDGQVAAFRERPLEGSYPYLWLDAKYLKVRDGAHVYSKALMVAFGVHDSGRREVIGIEVAELFEAAEEDLLAFYRFPEAHWKKLRSTNNIKRVNKEIARRSDVVGIFPNDRSVIRLIGALLIEQNDEWLLTRGYLSAESKGLLLEEEEEGTTRKEVPQLKN